MTDQTTDMKSPCDHGFETGVKYRTPSVKFMVVTALGSTPVAENKKYNKSFVSPAASRTQSGMFGAAVFAAKPGAR